MPLTQTELLALQQRIAGALTRHLAPLFKRGTLLSFAARTPDNPEADVLVTSETDLEELRKLVGRSMARPAVGDGGPIPPVPADGVTLSADEAAFLAARLRRLCERFDYPLPNMAASDASMIGIAGSCIGAILAGLPPGGPASLTPGCDCPAEGDPLLKAHTLKCPFRLGRLAVPVNGIAADWFHDEGAIARCSYCSRYSLDPRTLSDRQPVCECGERHGWSGSFKKPGPDAKWSGRAPSAQDAPKNIPGIIPGKASTP